ncbi:MAG: hypothetical protein L0L41_06705, partial [Acetobacter sp.]|nr:hypothetical protein [Acetobacter sp.]
MKRLVCALAALGSLTVLAGCAGPVAPAHGHVRTTRTAMLVPAYGMMTITGMAVGILVVAGHALHRAPPWAGRVWGLAAPVVAIIMEGAGPAPAGVVARMVA